MENTKSAGFTMVEILMVIGLIGLIMAVMVPHLTEHRRVAEEKTAKMKIKSIETALQVYLLKNGRYPTTEEGLQKLFSDGILDEIPTDPWQRHYAYSYPGVHRKKGYDIYSLGADGVQSTDDIGNWKK